MIQEKGISYTVAGFSLDDYLALSQPCLSLMPEPRFQFYEHVRVVSTDPELAEIQGEVGVILGRAELDDGAFSYGVFIDRDEICWDLPEEALVSMGQIDQCEDHYDGTSIGVRVDEQGRGWLADEG